MKYDRTWFTKTKRVKCQKCGHEFPPNAYVEGVMVTLCQKCREAETVYRRDHWDNTWETN